MKPRKRFLLAFGAISILVLGWALVRPPTGLEARVFSTPSDCRFFECWLKIQVDVELRLVARSALPRGQAGRVVAMSKEATFTVPGDLRLREVPWVVMALERHVYGEDRPAFATSRTLAEVLAIALRVGRGQVREASWVTRPWALRRVKKLEALRQALVSGGASDRAGVGLDDLPLPAALDRLREGLPKRFPDAEQEARLRRFLDAVQAKPKNLDPLLARELEEALPFAAFQVGAQRLARRLTCFTQADFRFFRSQRKAYRIDAEGLSAVERPLWEGLNLPERASDLERARQGGATSLLATLELDAMKAIQSAVAQFPWSQEDNDASDGAPALMLKSKDLRCVGMAVLIHACLRSLGIAHDGLSMPEHVAILARTADGRDWIMDATGGPAPKAVPLALPWGRNVPAQAMDYPDFVCRLPAERTLAAAILWNQASQHLTETPGRLHPWRQRFFAWNPGDLNALQGFYIRQTQPREAGVWLGRILQRTPDDPAANLDLWALERDRGRTQAAQAAWEKAMRPASGSLMAAKP